MGARKTISEWSETWDCQDSSEPTPQVQSYVSSKQIQAAFRDYFTGVSRNLGYCMEKVYTSAETLEVCVLLTLVAGRTCEVTNIPFGVC